MNDANTGISSDEEDSPSATDSAMSIPEVSPNPEVVNRFWKRVAELTTRFHDADNVLVSGHELKDWVAKNQDPCAKCKNSKSGRICVIDDDSASCKTCREAKIGCDRKTQFLFETTRDEFFPTLDQFLQAYRSREPGRLRRFKRQSSPRIISKVKPISDANRLSFRRQSARVDSSASSADESVQLFHEVHHLRARTAQLEAANLYHSVNVQKSAFTLGAISAHVESIGRIVNAATKQSDPCLADCSTHVDYRTPALDTATLAQLRAEVGAVSALLKPVFTP
ncbi:hypothetical protein C8R47DRAFT_751686 [Mycena vitilis]|nr:hypothetical protein C8R47DRAFT_751686 [Mycena vitilis]